VFRSSGQQDQYRASNFGDILNCTCVLVNPGGCCFLNICVIFVVIFVFFTEHFKNNIGIFMSCRVPIWTPELWNNQCYFVAKYHTENLDLSIFCVIIGGQTAHCMLVISLSTMMILVLPLIFLQYQLRVCQYFLICSAYIVIVCYAKCSKYNIILPVKDYLVLFWFYVILTVFFVISTALQILGKHSDADNQSSTTIYRYGIILLFLSICDLILCTFSV